MAQVNLTLSQEEVLHILSANRDDAFRYFVERILNQIMLIESSDQLGAQRHERTNERQDYRNGSRERRLNTRLGTIELEVPRHRNQPFHTMIFDNYKRSEAALISAMVEMVINGVSTRKVSKVVEELCGTSFSKSSVSTLCKTLDKEIALFKNRPLDDLNAPFLMVDATYFKARENHTTVSKAFFVAMAFNQEGIREIVGFDIFDIEDNPSWLSFFKGLKSRGLTNVRMVISDGHTSILHAIAKVYPKAAWQRCQFHFSRNIVDKTPKKYQEGLRTELRNMFAARNIKEARRIRDEIIQDYEPVAPEAMSILDNGFEDSMTIMDLPTGLQPKLRTSNPIERLNRELKRRSSVIGIFPNPESVLRLMGAVTIEYNDEISIMQRLYSKETYEKMKVNVFPKLEEKAVSQRALLNAA